MNKQGLPKIFIPFLLVVAIIVVFCISGSYYINSLPEWIQSAWLLFAIMIGSLIGYFFYVKSLPPHDQNAADSVYYFGFSLTIITLATSSIIHFGAGSDNLDNLGLIFSQFGIGLIATCIGLILRLWLIADLEQQDDLYDEDAEEKARYQLVSNLTNFSAKLEQLHIDLYQDLQQQQAKFYQKTVDDLKRLGQDIIQEIRDCSIESMKMIQDHKLLLEQAQIHIVEEALNNFKNRIKIAGQEMGEIHQQMSQLDFKVISQDTQQSLGQLNHSIHQFSANTLQNTQRLEQSMQQFVAATDGSTTHLNKTRQDFSEFSRTMNQYRGEVDVLTQGLKLTNSELVNHHQHLEQHIQDLNQNLGQYSVVYQQYHQVSTDSIQKAQQAVDKVAQALTEVANKAVAKKTENPKSKIDKGMM